MAKPQTTPPSDLATSGTLNSHGEDGDKTDAGGDVRETEPLAVVLVNAMFHLLFLPEFTIEDPKLDFSEVRLTSRTTVVMSTPQFVVTLV